MFWCVDRQAFLHVPYDCTAHSVQDIADEEPRKDWKRLSFAHISPDDVHCISLVGHLYENNELGAEGSPVWMPELLPEAYQYHDTPRHPGYCHLAGQLSILLGLVAFSTTEDTMLATIQNSFLHPTKWGWTPHGRVGTGSK